MNHEGWAGDEYQGVCGVRSVLLLLRRHQLQASRAKEQLQNLIKTT
jgi:hypothetical protein